MIDVTRESGLVNAMGATPLPSPGVTRVLIVDDEISTRKLLAAMLGDAGVTPGEGKGVAPIGFWTGRKKQPIRNNDRRN